MDKIPFDSVILLVAVDVVIVGGLSMLLGMIVGRARGAVMWRCLTIGLAAPVVGPLIWMLLPEPQRAPTAPPSRVSLGISHVAATATLVTAAVVFLVAAAFRWGHLDGAVDGANIRWEAPIWDGRWGLVATLGSSLLLVVSVILTIRRAAAVIAAVLVSVIGAGWLLVTVDALIVMSAVNSSSGQDLSGTVGPSGGLWLALMGAVLATAGAIPLGFLHPTPRTQPVSVDRLSPHWMTGRPYGSSSAAESATTGGHDYGDGF